MADNQPDERRYEVRGPTSALTSFLRSKNIRVPNASQYRRRGDATPVLENGQEAPAAPATAAESSSSGAAAQASAATRPTASPSSRRASAVRRRPGASMNFAEEEDDEEEDDDSISTAAAHATPNKRARLEPDDRGEGSSTSAANGSTSTLGNHSLRHTATGSVDFCAQCAKRFTITAYTIQTSAGGLCHRCGPLHGKRSAGASGSASTSAVGVEQAKKAKSAPRRKPNQAAFDKMRLPSLQSLCINIIANHIEHVEALIGIGGQNMNAISKSIAKNRRLSPQTMRLFLQPSVKQLAFYDCSQLDSDALASIAAFCPFVEEINLQLCGMLDNAVMEAWGKKLPKLSKVELYGPFLVRVAAWHQFFETIGDRLTSFKIRESPRFDKSCCEALVKHCPNLTELGLAQIGPLNAECLAVIKSYGQQLTYLDISDPGVSAPGVPPKSLEDDAVVDVLKEVGARLVHLDISRNADLTSRTLLEGILENCISLQTLNMVMMQAEELQAEHFRRLFEGLSQRGGAKLSKLSLERCLAVDDTVIEALVKFCGSNLVDLNVNSCDKITAKGFQLIAEGCPALTMLDVGFCRQVTDVLVMDMVNSMPHLREIWLYSCNKITPTLHSNRVRLIGKEKYAQELL